MLPPRQKPPPYPFMSPVTGPLARAGSIAAAFNDPLQGRLAVADYLQRAYARTPPKPIQLGPISSDNHGRFAPQANAVAQFFKQRTADGDVRLAYDPRPFKGPKQLVEVMKPPGYASFPPDVEYQLKFKDVGVQDGDLRGRATEYWRGTKDHAENNGSGDDLGHGLHDNTMKPNSVTAAGASGPDRTNFLKALNAGARMLATRDVAGITSVLTRPEVMARTNYNKAEDVWDGLNEAYWDDSGRELSSTEAMALKDAQKARMLEQKANTKRPGGR